uniref:DUF7730 domain-containing protein n=1 Tax=Talaromyces marneffei PM1 TaxID=1077442 RepID=A0A093URJ5_TALMA
MSFYCAGNGFPTNSQISKERKRFRAKPLPPNRPRALTLPLENHDGAQDKIDRAQQHILSKIIQKIKAPQSQTSAQKQSPLIIRLPYEIRMVIWRYLLCDQRLHLVRAPKRLLGIRCDGDEFDGDCNHACWGFSTIRVRFGPRAVGYYKGMKSGARLSLLYSGNMFDFNNPDTILSLSQTVLRSRLNLLRVVRLQYSFPKFLYILSNRGIVSSPTGITPDQDQLIEDPNLVAPFDAKTWEQACTVLASLTGLQKLYMHLGGAPLDEPELMPSAIKPILGSLMQVWQPGLQVFEVSVPREQDPETVYDVKGAPFRLVSRDSRCTCG